MLRTYWNLRESPFRGGRDWQQFFAAPTQDEALARLQFLIDQQRRLGLLFGPSGVGKSLLLDVFARGMRRRGAQVANISMRGIGLHEFLWLLAAELRLNPDRRDQPFQLWRSIADRLVENRYQQFLTVLLLDDADEASQDVLDHVIRLAHQDGSGTLRLTIVLSAVSNALLRSYPRLLELTDLRIDLDPWEEVDTAQYVRTAIEQAGRSTPIFTDDGLAALHDLCAGIPRRVNQVANLALLAGAGRKLSRIDADLVQSAYHELDVQPSVA